MEKNTKDKEYFNKNYVIVGKKGWGGTAKTYLINERKTAKKYLAKIIDIQYKDYYIKEAEFLDILNKQKNPNVIKKIGHGIGYIDRLNHEKEELQYIILEFATHRELYDYIFYPNEGFGETLGKAIFAQLLNGVKGIHDLGYCHKDLSLSNIFLDENFVSKVGDFGSARKNASNIDEYFQQINYKAPEVLDHKPHNGIKADIFSLGLILFILVFGVPPFDLLNEKNPLYSYIEDNTPENIHLYWIRIEGQLQMQFSDEFKDLFIKMVLSNPNDRISIQEILNHPWIQSLNNMDKE